MGFCNAVKSKSSKYARLGKSTMTDSMAFIFGDNDEHPVVPLAASAEMARPGVAGVVRACSCLRQVDLRQIVPSAGGCTTAQAQCTQPCRIPPRPLCSDGTAMVALGANAR
eukprot:TRINITY_DN5901_c1_g1_i4.p1 TRINITY_DN5901_c1_g1~~TRINITY_DN5901_c1_g1_i4.p1  ORF type:complete len:111 (-),score=7.38 TRINITY_DN5901_c1_g1_i4:142-474(-)